MNNCETCQHWDEDQVCRLTLIRDEGETPHRTKAHVWPLGAVPRTIEEWVDLPVFGLKTQPDFGCVQHQPIDPTFDDPPMEDTLIGDFTPVDEGRDVA